MIIPLLGYALVASTVGYLWSSLDLTVVKTLVKRKSKTRSSV